jgi:hypothetical protein
MAPLGNGGIPPFSAICPLWVALWVAPHAGKNGGKPPFSL